MPTEPDYYDQAVAYFLRADPPVQAMAWANPSQHRFGQLFAFLSPTRGNCPPGMDLPTTIRQGQLAGCPSLIASRAGHARGPNWSLDLELTEQIRAQRELLVAPCGLAGWPATRAQLEAFAHWQRVADARYQRVPPPTMTSDLEETPHVR